MCRGNVRCTLIAVFFQSQQPKVSTVEHHEPCAKASTCSRQCGYLMLSVGNVHVTVRNYEQGGQGSHFLACSNSGGVLPQAKRARRHRFASALPVGAGGVRGSQHSIGMECSFLVQGPVSREALRSFETTDTLHLFYSQHIHFHPLHPAPLTAAQTQSLKLVLLSRLHFCIRLKTQIHSPLQENISDHYQYSCMLLTRGQGF